VEAWEVFVQALEDELGAPTVDRWVRSLKILRFDAGNLYLEAKDPVQIAWFEEHIRPKLQGKFLNNNHRPIRVHLAYPETKEKSSQGKGTGSPFPIHQDRLDPELTFENFLTSSKNSMAVKLLSSLDEPMFNPIYLYGPKSAGKTHLLAAAAHSLQKRGMRVFFVRSETFTSHVVQAIRLGHMQQFRKIYREIDALLVDDIDLFSRKDATQEEFFHTFNTLHTTGKQLLFSSSVPPSKLVDIEARLISRFEWGITIPLERIDAKEILRLKTNLWKLSYSPEIIDYLAEEFPSNPLLALQALSIRAKGRDSLLPSQAASLLYDLLEHEKEKALTPEKIVRAIAAHYGIKAEDLLGKSQTRECALPRQVAMYLCREKLQLPYQKIGEIFGRDHSTAMNGIKLIQKGIEERKGDLLAALSVDFTKF
jgi:chromosomal replication initiator protein